MYCILWGAEQSKHSRSIKKLPKIYQQSIKIDPKLVHGALLGGDGKRMASSSDWSLLEFQI